MLKSESIKSIAKALSDFQAEVKNPANSADNPFFKSKYAPLNEILNDVRPLLAKNGLSILQFPSGDGQNIIVTTTLLHESGEWIESDPLVLKATKADAQGAGSAITYARRYAVAAILGISSEDDDDGNVASHGKSKPDDKANEKPKTASPRQGQPASQPISQKALAALHAKAKDLNLSHEELSAWAQRDYGVTSLKELTDPQSREFYKLLDKSKPVEKAE
ncbi:MAG: ERF family protein [Alphaproteobacteria bacterium]|nr:ERF family protein [Alphaproteobacteria bacterium]